MGDCLEYMRTMPDKSVDAVITDPPYGIDYQSAWRTDRAQWKPKIINDKEPFLEWIELAYRICKNGGAVVTFCRWDVEDAFKAELVRVGFLVKSQIIWDKVSHGMGDLSGSFAPRHENALFAVKGDFSFWDYRPQDVIRVQRVSPEKMVHPNEKPHELFMKIIEPIVKRGGVVLDCFMGSGSSGRAAVYCQRDYIGIEADEKYFAAAERRIKQAQEARQLEF